MSKRNWTFLLVLLLLPIISPPTAVSSLEVEVFSDFIRAAVLNDTNPVYEVNELGSGAIYSVSKQAVIEFTDMNSNEVYDFGTDTIVNTETLTTNWSWNFTSLPEANDSVFELYGAAKPAFSSAAYNITLSNQLLGSSYEIKFDIFIDGYTFVSASNYLAVQFQIAGGSISSSSLTEVEFGDAYFSIISTANSGSVDAGLSTHNTGSVEYIYISYSSFTDELFHDPTLGVGSGGSGGGDTPFPIVTSIFGIIGLMVLNYKKRKYQA